VNDQRGQAQRARGHWTEILFFAIFRTFAMDTTLLRLIFIQNVKKVKINPPYWTPQKCLSFPWQNGSMLLLSIPVFSAQNNPKKKIKNMFRTAPETSFLDIFLKFCMMSVAETAT
jgi:hypothetical protein